jgi:hypothetical protein
MALHSETRAASPVARDRRSAHARWSRRLPALAAFGLFVGGLLVAVGLGGEAAAAIAAAAPWLAGAAAAVLAAWLLWRLRPWALVFRAVRTAGRALRRVYGLARVLIAALPGATWALLLQAEAFASRPRQPWQPPAVLTRTRMTLGSLVFRLDPVREWAHARWRSAAVAAVVRAPAVAGALTSVTRTAALRARSASKRGAPAGSLPASRRRPRRR